MAESHLSKTETPPPHAQLVQMATAHWVSHIVYVAAKLGLADHLVRPKRADELAGPTNTDGPSLYRLMRTLAHLGLMTEDGAQHFSLTPLGDALKTGAPGAARAAILTLASPMMLRGWEHLLHSVQTGKSGVEQSLGMPLFDWLAKHPEEATPGRGRGLRLLHHDDHCRRGRSDGESLNSNSGEVSGTPRHPV